MEAVGLPRHALIPARLRSTPEIPRSSTPVSCRCSVPLSWAAVLPRFLAMAKLRHDFTPVDDVVGLNIRAAGNLPPAFSNRFFNAGNGGRITPESGLEYSPEVRRHFSFTYLCACPSGRRRAHARFAGQHNSRRSRSRPRRRRSALKKACARYRIIPGQPEALVLTGGGGGGGGGGGRGVAGPDKFLLQADMQRPAA